jgi:hypothetical protein
VIPTSGSVSSGNVTWARPGGRFPLRTLPPRAQVWAAAEDSISLGVACLISYWLTTRFCPSSIRYRRLTMRWGASGLAEAVALLAADTGR